MTNVFKKIKIESFAQLDGNYTLRMEFGKESREFPNLTRNDLDKLAYGIMTAPYDEDQSMIQLELIRNEAKNNDNTGGS